MFIFLFRSIHTLLLIKSVTECLQKLVVSVKFIEHRRRGGAESVTNLILVFVLFRRGPEV